jgi:hypothetical protein
MAKLPEWARAYRNFAAAFVVLHGRANAETSLKPTIKNSTICSGSPAEPLGEHHMTRLSD